MLLGVLLFTIDQLHGVSQQAQARLDDDVPAYWPGSAEARRAASAEIYAESENGPPPSRFEMLVTDANEVLRGPFENVVPPTADVWTRELVPAFLAILLWGVGLTTLSNIIGRVRQRQPQYAPPPNWQ